MKRRGFTLIELLVVIAIIAILAAILFPVFAQARDKARGAACLSNAKQQALAIHMYAQDYDETLPIVYYGEWGVKPQPAGHFPWLKVLMPYVKNKGVYTCPSLASAHWDTLAGAYGKGPDYEFPSVVGYGINILMDKKPLAAMQAPASTIAIAGLRRPWASTASSISGPTASRTAFMTLRANLIDACPSSGLVAWNGHSFMAVKPSATICCALSAISSGVSPRGPFA